MDTWNSIMDSSVPTVIRNRVVYDLVVQGFSFSFKIATGVAGCGISGSKILPGM